VACLIESLGWGGAPELFKKCLVMYEPLPLAPLMQAPLLAAIQPALQLLHMYFGNRDIELRVLEFVSNVTYPDNMKNTAVRYPGVDLVDRYQLGVVLPAAVDALKRHQGRRFCVRFPAADQTIQCVHATRQCAGCSVGCGLGFPPAVQVCIPDMSTIISRVRLDEKSLVWQCAPNHTREHLLQ
jgi:hypothetical protein